MKAIQYKELGGPEVLHIVDVPDPQPKQDEVVVRLHAASVNHGDIHYRKGLPGSSTPLPHIPGLDGAGVIDGTKQRVLINPGMSCGSCRYCLRGEKSYCKKYRVIGRETDGTYAEKIAVPKQNLVSLPDHVGFEPAAAMPVVFLTAWNMVVTKARVQPGQKVLIMSAGSGVGHAAIQIAKLCGATVYATSTSDEKLDRATKELGADSGINYAKTEIDDVVRTLTQKKGVDVVIDHVGGQQWTKLLRATRNGGTIVTCGATDGFDPETDIRQIFYRQVRVLGATMGNDAELNAVLRLLFEEKLKVVIGKKLELQHAVEAHSLLEQRHVFGKIVLAMPTVK